MTPTEITRLVHDTMPLCATLGVEGVECAATRVVLELPFDPRLCTTGGILHGGAIMTLADATGALCAFLNLPEGASGTATIESKTNLLASVRGGSLRATAVPLHVGSRTIVVESVLHNVGRLVAKTIQTQIVR